VPSFQKVSVDLEMDEILKKKERTRRSEASIFFDLQLKRPTAKDYADFNFTALCDEKEVRSA
jgi:hypothetical protein